MSNDNPENDLNLDLHFLPSWAQESPEINRYANYEGEREHRRGRDRDRRGGPGRFGGGDRPRGPRPEGNRDRDRQGDQRPKGRAREGGPRHDRKGGRRPFEKRPEQPLPEVNLSIVPEEKGVDLLTKQIRVTGRAYPLFDIARLVLQKEDRYRLEFSTKKNADGTVAQSLYVCALDDTLWLSEDDAVSHILDKHLATFYEVRKTPTDPPKGTYTFVAQCGMSGEILGPPNYHDYQNKLRQLHAEKFSRMPFDKFKSRVKIVKDEEVVKQWIEEQSFKTEYVVLNVPEPLTLDSFEEVARHFRETHLASIVTSVETHSVAGDKSRRVGSRDLQRLVIRTVDEQKRFPLKLVTTLSHKFASRGLQFFKVNKTVVHVAVARPHFLDLENTSVSDGVKKIVNYVDAHPRCSVKELVDFLAPLPPKTEPEPAASATEAVEQPDAATAKEKPAHPEPTAEQKQVLADLHWLVHQGHVIEFASGELETAKKPNPKPQPQPKKKAEPKPVKEDTSAPAPAEGQVRPDAEAGTSVPAESVSSDAGPAPEATGVAAPATGAPSTSGEAAGFPDVIAPEEPPAVAAPASSDVTAPAEPAEPLRKPVIDGSAVGEIQLSDPDDTAPESSPAEREPAVSVGEAAGSAASADEDGKSDRTPS